MFQPWLKQENFHSAKVFDTYFMSDRLVQEQGISIREFDGYDLFFPWLMLITILGLMIVQFKFKKPALIYLVAGWLLLIFSYNGLAVQILLVNLAAVHQGHLLIFTDFGFYVSSGLLWMYIIRNRSGGKKSSDIYPTGVGSAGSKDGAD
jgi:hypothetical protein